ncbi:ubiquitin-binding protein cue5 [Arthrobotrys musiformis]|uniref:Ubiquitin-binding protein cue5 n=1 Tax=Arthrobotrys musiformis TaxID=47236 RepID=A0AAV9WKL8_9PEZI
MSGAADKQQDLPPAIPPKERSPSPDDGLLREEPLDDPPTTKPLKSTDVPTATAPPAASQTVTAPPAPTVESVAEEGEEAPPPKPPRPVSKFEQGVATLAEAFPDIDVGVIKAVLTASGGRVEPAFNALLGMSDPSAAVEIEEPPPPQPPRPRQQQQQQPRDFRSSDHYNPAGVYNDQPQPKTSTPASQMEADELYARQLAEHYGGLPRENRQGRGGYGNYPEQQQQQQQQQRRRQHPQEEEDRERSFFDDVADDLPILRDNLKKGFLDTQTKFNKFITDFGKKLSGEEEDGQHQQQQQGAGRGQGQGYQGQGQRSQQYPQRYSSRRSGDGYDADPEVIQGDFSHLELRDNSDEPRRRPLANPNLFGSNTNPSGAPRKTVGFADQSEEDLYRKPTSTGPNNGSNTASNPTGGATGPAPTTGSKWAPLTTVDPTPISNDPFQLADSDDEHDNIQTTSAKTGPQESGTKSTAK